MCRTGAEVGAGRCGHLWRFAAPRTGIKVTKMINICEVIILIVRSPAIPVLMRAVQDDHLRYMGLIILIAIILIDRLGAPSTGG